MNRSSEDGLMIGALASAAAVNVETIRSYQRRGLLRKPTRSYGRIRRYDAADVARVRFVKTAQRLGFSLAEIVGLLRLDDGAHCDEARVAAEHKLAIVRAKLTDLHRVETALATLVDECSATTGKVRCPLIAALHFQ